MSKCHALCPSRVTYVQGVIGETYNIGTQKERQVVEVARDIAARFNLSEDQIVKVKDRAFNDQRCEAHLRQNHPGHASSTTTTTLSISIVLLLIVLDKAGRQIIATF